MQADNFFRLIKYTVSAVFVRKKDGEIMSRYVFAVPSVTIDIKSCTKKLFANFDFFRSKCPEYVYSIRVNFNPLYQRAYDLNLFG